jgi:hypothetical protein
VEGGRFFLDHQLRLGAEVEHSYSRVVTGVIDRAGLNTWQRSGTRRGDRLGSWRLHWRYAPKSRSVPPDHAIAVVKDAATLRAAAWFSPDL